MTTDLAAVDAPPPHGNPDLLDWSKAVKFRAARARCSQVGLAEREVIDKAMSEPQLQPPATADEARVLDIEHTWDDLGDEALEAALTELQGLARSSSLRYGYQRKALTLAELIDPQFVNGPTVDLQPTAAEVDDAQGTVV